MGRTIPEWRTRLNLSQEDVCKIINMKITTYRNKEQGKTKWYFDEIKSLSEAFGCSISEIDV